MGTWSTATALTALGCAASGGAYSVYSTFTATALAKLPAAQGMAAMQQINEAAPRSVTFMALTFVPGLAGAVLLVRALVGAPEPHRALVVVGAGVYLVGVIGTTIAFHVPRNDALAALDAVTQHEGWHAWLRAWVLGNHVRTVSGLAAGAALAWSLRT